MLQPGAELEHAALWNGGSRQGWWESIKATNHLSFYTGSSVYKKIRDNSIDTWCSLSAVLLSPQTHPHVTCPKTPQDTLSSAFSKWENQDSKRECNLTKSDSQWCRDSGAGEDKSLLLESKADKEYLVYHGKQAQSHGIRHLHEAGLDHSGDSWHAHKLRKETK